MNKFLGLGAVAAAAFAVSAPACADVLTFDTVTTGNNLTIPNGYGGLNWDNFSVADGTIRPYTGYQNGIVSGNYTAFNGGGDPATISSSTTFDLVSGYFTGAFRDGLDITAVGYNGGTQLFTTTFTVDFSSPTLETFDWSGLTSVTFSSTGGTLHPYVSVYGPGYQFALDNLTVNEAGAVPEPATWAMMLLGFGAIGFVMRRKRTPVLAHA